jgi:hypothetical protein
MAVIGITCTKSRYKGRDKTVRDKNRYRFGRDRRKMVKNKNRIK